MSVTMGQPTNLAARGISLAIKLICPECNEDPPNLIEEYSAGDTICGSCGLVLGDRIVDTRSEWRTFSNNDEGNDDPSRVGAVANPLLNGSQLETVISSGGGLQGMKLARTQGKSSAVKGERNLLMAYKEISTICEAISLPRVIADIAKQLYKRVEESKLLRGKSQDSLISACIFIACRQSLVPRTFKEICSLTHVPVKDIGRVCKILKALLTEGGALYQEKSSNNLGHQESYANSVSTNAQDLMIRFCNRLLLPANVQVAASRLAARATELGILAGRSPISVAASVLYMITHLMGHGKSPKEISDIAGVSDSTIRTSYRILHSERDKLLKNSQFSDPEQVIKLLPKP